MMRERSSKYVPILTSEAGLCLTAANWQEGHVSAGSFYLESLLIKPGIDRLRELENIKRYFAWTDTFILNAANIKANKQGVVSLSSPYDGSKVQCTLPEIIELIVKINPDIVLLPRVITKDDLNSWAKLPDSIFPYLHDSNNIAEGVGVYFYLGGEEMNIPSLPHVPCYAFGEITREMFQQLGQLGVEYVEFDEPASLGLQGVVYRSDGQLEITNPTNELDFSVIDDTCPCPTCGQGFTRAYLHHLYQHTPLLCYRLLMQHNVELMGNARE
jgi:queuine tRNA-ribosyltransferase